MISPSSFEVFALKFLQKSMILTPCGPSAVPTGGAGVAFPAAIWSFTIACTFFAIDPYRAPRSVIRDPDPIGSRIPGNASRFLQFLNLQKIQFHRRRSAEDRHHHLQGVAIE